MPLVHNPDAPSFSLRLYLSPHLDLPFPGSFQFKLIKLKSVRSLPNHVPSLVFLTTHLSFLSVLFALSSKWSSFKGDLSSSKSATSQPKKKDTGGKKTSNGSSPAERANVDVRRENVSGVDTSREGLPRQKKSNSFDM